MIPAALALGLWLAPPAATGLSYWNEHHGWDLTPQPALTQPVDRIVVDKRYRSMVAMRDGKIVKRYPIALGFAPEGDKFQEGDGRTPEGAFRVNRRNPQSQYHLSLGIDYPHPEDTAAARAQGVSPGGDIFIHGQPNVRRGKPDLAGDWTAGCVAVTNEDIEELWRVVPGGTIVEILP